MATFDALIIGTGQAGPTLASRLAGSGMTVAVVERGHFGGTCINNGCTPTKAMVASAYAAHLARRAAEYGVVLSEAPRVDMKRVKARKDQIVGNSRDNLERWLEGTKGVTVYRGQARFTGKDTVRVNDEEITAERIFLNVGGRPRLSGVEGVATVPLLTNESMMDVDFVPEHLLVIGGSYVGLEFAQMFRRFGSRVTVIEMGPHLVPREDDDVSEAIREFLAAEDIAVRVNAKCLSVAPESNGITAQLACSEGAPQVHGSHVLLAIGREPNTDDLGLDLAGIKLDAHGYIDVDQSLRTSNPKVWALGDCNGKGAFTHTAYNDYEIVADNLLANASRKYTDRIPVYALYTDPPLGRVGMNAKEIRKAGLAALVGKRPMTRVARAIEKGETHGFLEIYVERDSKRILGASLLGTGCDEAVHSLIDAIYARLPYTQFQKHVRIHPTVSELLPTTLEELSPLT
ncbi:MAG TPA: FAD-containing oxidoreductase [Steroidobacteraceae bacterium]|nr:FAD-containing oxidoreductase [Steroidobacteraceae bacterium]